MKITLSTLRELRAYPHFKLGALCTAAGHNESTIRTKVKQGRELSESESEDLSKAFGPYYSESDVKPLLEALEDIRGMLEGMKQAHIGNSKAHWCIHRAKKALNAWEGVGE